MNSSMFSRNSPRFLALVSVLALAPTAAFSQAARDARSTLAASVCVQKFAMTAGAAEKLTALKEASTWERDNFIEDGGWAKLIGIEKAIPGAAELCAEELIALESLPVQNVDAATTTDG